MEQLFLFAPDVQGLHKQVEKELGRIEGEDWDEFQELVCFEVNARLKEANRFKKKPDYSKHEIKQNPYKFNLITSNKTQKHNF